MAVGWAVVKWNEHAVLAHKLSKIDKDDHWSDFYAVWSAKPDGKGGWDLPADSLLYLGMSYSQPIKQRIEQDHSSWKRVSTYSLSRRDRDIIVCLGWISGKSAQRTSQQHVKDVEALLILHNQPRFNSKNKKSYSGRSPFVVINAGGYAPLKRFAPSTTRALNLFKSDVGMDYVRPFFYEDEDEDEADDATDDDE